VLLGEVLRGEVVELVGVVDADLRDDRAVRRVGAEALQDPALHLATPFGRDFDENLGIVLLRPAYGVLEAVTGRHLADADARPAPRGLDEDRVAE
jgi:hypothetical protein